MKRIPLRSKDLQELLGGYDFVVAKKDLVEVVDDKIILINKKVNFFFYENRVVPTLHILQTQDLLKKVVVDMGAVPFLVGGADVMRPGIKDIDLTIMKNDFVVVLDMNHKKALCVGIALFSGEEMTKLNTGKVIRNIHFIGDRIWTFI